MYIYGREPPSTLIYEDFQPRTYPDMSVFLVLYRINTMGVYVDYTVDDGYLFLHEYFLQT